MLSRFFEQVVIDLLLFVTVFSAQAQLEVAKLIGNNNNDYNIGFGAFLKAGYPISDGSDISIEGNAVFFLSKHSNIDGRQWCP